jgi:hypothetical protein
MWFKWLLVGLYVLEVVGAVSLVGKQRAMWTPGSAALHTLFNLALIAGLLYFWR